MQKTATGGGRGRGGRRGMVSGLVLQIKRSDIELGHSPVLDDDFPQDGTMAIFIVAVT